MGTPADIVTFSLSIRRWRVSPSPIFGPGKTSFAPTTVAPYGMLQALTWNIGTTGITTSRFDSAMTSGITAA